MSGFDDFSVVKFLGKGNFSNVYLMNYKNTTVVVKSIQKNIATHYYNEFDIVKILLTLQNIFTPIYKEIIDMKDYKWIVMEYLPDFITLNLLEHNDKVKNLKYISEQLCAGISFLHSNNIIHRDIKDENILINPVTYKIKYIDFTFSLKKETFQIEKLMKQVGSESFMDPELFNEIFTWDKLLSTDIYSIGCVIHDMLTRCTPIEIFISKLNTYIDKNYISIDDKIKIDFYVNQNEILHVIKIYQSRIKYEIHKIENNIEIENYLLKRYDININNFLTSKYNERRLL